jgi:hypothetical protein
VPCRFDLAAAALSLTVTLSQRPQSKTRRPDQTASRWAALQGDRGAFELHWTAGGRPLAVGGAVGVCLGRNDVARASRGGWLYGLGSRRSKPLMPERSEPDRPRL